MRLWCSPTEPAALRALGTTSSLPERYGADFFWSAQRQLWGVQRKEISDLIASKHDGRLEVELGQMTRLDVAVLIVEGRLRWTDDGDLLDGWNNLSRRQLRGMLWTVRQRGLWVEYTDGHADTADTLRWLVDWSRKPRHSGLRGRPAPAGSWGQVTNRDWGVHLLTSFQGIGFATAEAMWDHFDGVPIRWEVGEKELMDVPGVGKGRAKKLVKALGNGHE